MSFTQADTASRHYVTCVRCRVTAWFLRGDPALTVWKVRHLCRPSREGAA